MNGTPSETLLFVGRFHPALVHLPIGLIVLVFFLEVLALWPRFKQARVNNGLILALAVLASAGSALCGWFLSLGGDYNAQILSWHKWTGLGVAGACLLAFALRSLRLGVAYGITLTVTFIGLAVASHFGGSLTHGSDYLTRYAPEPLRRWLGGSPKPASLNPDSSGTNQSVFVAAVLPILERNCVNCHGPEKAKAELRLDTLESIRKGSEHGPILEPGHGGNSAMIKRLLLPVAHEDHMPPEGKPQLTSDEIALLQWWIDAGAPGDKSVAELKPPANIQRLLSAKPAAPAVATAVAAVAPKPQSELLPLTDQLTSDLGISITALSPTEPWFQCNASLAKTNFGDAELAKLAPLALNLRWLDLAGTRVTDTGLVQVAAMKHLTKLHLERTTITDAGLTNLSDLPELEYLNLYGTPITDEGLVHLKPLSRLRQLYLWQTKVSTNAVREFSEERLDKEQIKKWQDEIAALKAKLKSQGVAVEVGIPLMAAKPASAKPINDKCPVSGKDIDPSKTSLFEGKLVAFCCGDCKAKFDQDSKPFLAKLNLTASSAAKPINDKCPVSGKEIDPSKTSTVEGKLVAFCCADCKAKFDQDSKPFLAKLGLTNAASSAKPEEKP